jgi:membrane protein YqaA with SNARE-associated domain
MASTAVPGISTIAAVKIFSALYDRVLSWSRHPHADRYLGVVSFTESSFFPIPPDVLLAPMTLARPTRWVYLAALTTVTSVLGGLFGYLIGHWAIDAVLPWLQKVGYMGHFETAQQWFKDYGFWAIFAAGFTPIPYKVFTVAAGAASMALAPFILGSVIGRGARFFLVAALVRFGGAPIEAQIRRYIDTIGWTVLAALLVLLIIWQL